MIVTVSHVSHNLSLLPAVDLCTQDLTATTATWCGHKTSQVYLCSEKVSQTTYTSEYLFALPVGYSARLNTLVFHQYNGSINNFKSRT